MKFWKFTSVAALALAVAVQPMTAHADEPDAPACPTVRMSGNQTGMDGAIFTVDVSGVDYDVTFNWTISAGMISEGQGTPTITVGEVGAPGTTVTATVEIGGVPAGCYASDSATVEILAPEAQ